MAVNRFTGATNANTSVATNWSLGVVPTAADGNVATWDATSPNCTVNIALPANNVDFTGYTNTITFTTSITVSGNVTMSNTTFVAAGTGALIIATTANLTSGGGTWPGNFTFNGSFTFTITDSWTVKGNTALNTTTATTTVINGGNLTCLANITSSSSTNPVTGTSLVIAGGTGAVTLGTGGIRNNFTFAGVYSLVNLNYGVGVLTYSSGTVTHTGTLTISSSCTLNTAGILWNNVTFGATSTNTLTSDMTVNATLIIGGGSATVVINGQRIIANSGVTVNFNSGVSSGTTIIDWRAGAFNQTNTPTTGAFTLPLLINGGTGTLTINSPIRLDLGKVQYVSGLVTSTQGAWAVPNFMSYGGF